MTTKRVSWIPWFMEDFLGGTRGWTTGERWAYLMLLWTQWVSDDGTLDGSSQRRLSRMAEVDWHSWHNLKTRVLSKFEKLPDGRLFNVRLVKERIRCRRNVDQRVALVCGGVGKSKSPNDFNDPLPANPYPIEGREEERAKALSSLPSGAGPRARFARRRATRAPRAEAETEKERLKREALERIAAHNEQSDREKANGRLH